MASQTFIARFAGVCADCDAGINVADEVLFIEGGLTHALCPGEDSLSRPPGPICGSCFMELPTSGACGNCD